MYHRIIDPCDAIGSNPSVISATPGDFAEQMRYVARHYRVLSADELLDVVRMERPVPERALMISFDDAYRDFGENAWPILRRAGLPATVFVPTAYPGDPQRAFWWDRLASAIARTSRPTVGSGASGMLSLGSARARGNSLRKLRMTLKQRPHVEAMRMIDDLCAELGEVEPPAGKVLSWDQLRELRRDGVTLAAHTRTHAALTQLPLDEARAEICGSHNDLIRELGSAPPIFSYPFGAWDDDVVELVRQAGFEIAVTCVSGYNRIRSSDPLRLRRVNITLRTTPFLFRVRLLRYGCDLDRLRQLIHERRAGSIDHRRGAFGQI
jgi:peptidoglycan/xylan/chitin deacetylase (PgdA/CDA1 family)